MINLLFIFSVLFTQFQTDPWPRHTIDASSSGADGIKLGDINNDGLLDIVTGWEEGGLTKLYLHPGTEKVKEEWPSVITGTTPNVEDAVFADMNNDQRLDIVSSSEGNTEKVYVQFSPKKDFLNSSNWKQEILPASDSVTRWMYAEPLQVDGIYGTDLIVGGKGKNSLLAWFEAPKKSKKLEQWKLHPISPLGWLMSLIVYDMDKDGDADLVITDRKLGLRACRWLENPGIGSELYKPWENHMIGGVGEEVMFMTIADFNGEGEDEVIVCDRSSQTIRIFTRQDNKGLEWEEKIINIPNTVGNAKSIEVSDINKDGVNDLILSTNNYGEPKDGLIWIDGNHIDETGAIPYTSISGNHKAKYDRVRLYDVDADGDQDILICEENYGANSEGLGIIWYENPY